MEISPIKTPIVKPGDNLANLIKSSIPSLANQSVLIITSKIVSYCEKNIAPKKNNSSDKEEKHQLAKWQSDFWLDPHSSKYNMMLTIKNNILAVNAGIDESNSINGDYILWPKNSQKSANQIWQFLRKTYHLDQVGVILVDSKTTPLRWGVTGTYIAHCGFKALNDFRGKVDIFGRQLHMTQINVAEALAVAATLEMGETNEQTPLAIATHIKMIEFVDTIPSQKELKNLKIKMDDDVYFPILKNVKWNKGQSGR